MRIIPGNLHDPRVIELLYAHVSSARAQTGRDSAHALNIGGLQTPDVSFWAGWNDEHLLAIGALKQLSAEHGEVKSMHTAPSMRRLGAGSAMLRHIIDVARARGLSWLSLETGAWDYFIPARAFYQCHGFTLCTPFGDYADDPNSIFMSLDLRMR